MSAPAALPFGLRLYQAATTLAEPLAHGLVAWRLRRGKEIPGRIGERRGRPGLERPPGERLVWVHGASIGETLSLLPLIEHLAQRGLPVLVTSGTRTSAEILGRRLPPGALHQFVPLDVPRFLRRFLDHWRPSLALFAESEIWPNTLLALERRGTPLLLVNARMSDRSYRRWARRPDLALSLFGRVSAGLAQSATDAERLLALGTLRVETTGNMKFDAPPPPAEPHEVARLSGLLAGRPVWTAASTHPGEEGMVLAAHRDLAERHPGLLTVIAPRHPDRGEAIAFDARDAGFSAARRSEGAEPGRDVAVYVADTVGELGLFYRVSPVVFVGGSLVPHGGQNPIEPTKLGAAVLHGPEVHNFAEIYDLFDRAGGARPVADENDLVAALDALLDDPAAAREMARRGGEAVAAAGGALQRILAAVDAYLPGAAGR